MPNRRDPRFVTQRGRAGLYTLERSSVLSSPAGSASQKWRMNSARPPAVRHKTGDPEGNGVNSRLKSWEGRRMVLAATFRITWRKPGGLAAGLPPLFLRHARKPMEHAVVRDVS